RRLQLSLRRHRGVQLPKRSSARGVRLHRQLLSPRLAAVVTFAEPRREVRGDYRSERRRMKKVARIALSIALVSVACTNEVRRDPSRAGSNLEGGDSSSGENGSGGSGQPVCGAPAPVLPLSDG